MSGTRMWVGAALAGVLMVGGAAPAAAQAGAGQGLTPMDRIQIQQLVARYAFALDTGGNDGYDYADLFAEDGVFVGMNQGAKGRAFRGRESLAALARGGKRGPLYVSHFISNLRIEPTADGARGTQYAVIIEFGEGGKPSQITHGGFYRDEYARTPDGWRFKSRAFYGSEGGASPRQLQASPADAPLAPEPATPGSRRPRRAWPGAGPLTVDDYLDIQQLVSRYGYALDTGNNQGRDYADLFTADAEFSRPLTRGYDNLAKLALAQPHGPQYVRHYLMNHVIEPTADGAVGREYLAVLDIGENGKPGTIFIGGHYEDIYARTPQGWRFKRREFIPSRAGAAPPPAAAPASR